MERRPRQTPKRSRSSGRSSPRSVPPLEDAGNVFVNDAFGTAHRAHSSVVGVDHKWRVAGHLMKKELDFFQKVMENPQRPFLVIIGGSKVADKIKLINSMIDKADEIIIGGGMGYTFLKKIYGIPIGKSLFDAEGYKHIDEMLEKAKKKGVPMHFVKDIVCAKEFKNDTEARVFDIKTGIEDGWEGMDGGPLTIKDRSEVIARAKTIMWNGPTGVIEFPQFRKSSAALLQDIIKQTKKGAISVVGGGDSVSLVHAEKAEDKLSHVSTGGGASLELMEGAELPGVKHLSDISEIK